MAAGDFEEAKRWFEAGAQYHVDDDEIQLLEYNFGVLSALTGQTQTAREHFNKAKNCAIKSEASCAYQLHIRDGKLGYEEIFDPKSIQELADQAFATVSEM
jgi:hypothetical protein